MYLMLENVEILYFDFDDSILEVIKPELLPFSLRSRLKKSTDSKNVIKNTISNIIALKEFFGNRVLSLSRDNAKLIYTMFQLPQSNDLETRVNICLKCHGVNLQDCYWVRRDSEAKCWEDVNLINKRLVEIIDISLSGMYPTFTTELSCPELVTKGLFRKAWTRQNAKLILLKSDRHNEFINTKMEVLASKILDCLNNFPHVSYTGSYKEIQGENIYISQCENFSRKGFSFVEAREIKIWCDYNNTNFREWSLQHFGVDIANIVVADFIIMNTDRHLENYGFWMDNKTGIITEVAPVFDYNLALVSDTFNKDASFTLSQMFNENESIKSLAMELLHDSNLDINYDKLIKLEKDFLEFPWVYTAIKKRIFSCGLLEDSVASKMGLFNQQ